MRREALERLDRDGREALRRAAAELPARSVALARAADRRAVSGLCESGVRLALASAADLAGLRRAVEPAYALARREPRDAALIARVLRLRDSGDLGSDNPAAPPGCLDPG